MHPKTHPSPAGGRLFAPALRAWTNWRQSRRTFDRLHRLSDHQLADIGVRRDGIDRIVAAGSAFGD